MNSYLTLPNYFCLVFLLIHVNNSILKLNSKIPTYIQKKICLFNYNLYLYTGSNKITFIKVSLSILVDIGMGQEIYLR